MPTLSARFDDAFKYAHQIHAAQTRKGNSSPYIGHLMGVASIVLDDGGSEDEAGGQGFPGRRGGGWAGVCAAVGV